MNRISIQSSIINGTPHHVVYLSDGITITERAGSSLIRTIIRTHIAHWRDQHRVKSKTRAAGRSLAIPTETSTGTNTKVSQSTFIRQTPSTRIVRFMSRVDGVVSNRGEHVNH